ncbi:cofactor-independent phosphoglycerate mutase [Allorhodopirellula heiligendammensis]|uniref:Cofactor-independent phosphoglycerate mutase n=1 Tax=Allorhodopirellula heiligendammensis TaxID=2714739 RepID=A0A5C6BZZ7_9BACT|nr:cofactor-independent phosphoglycerate mutase [Allorhodopirellula heiligendammensis]TWU16951.1 cofactor-independent phosphoglycerate mutase [Allorhodopirellula heiligendammensis]
MKYVIIIPDGCADEPLETLGGKTPLQAANLPTMDAIAAAGCVGVTDNTPADFPAGSEVANLCLLGYDPKEFFTGRAPIEAAATGIQLGPYDCAIRCNFVTVNDQIMMDFTAGHISTEEGSELLAELNKTLLGGDHPAISADLAKRLEFVSGVSYRNLLIYRGDAEHPSPFTPTTRSSAPHDLTDLSIADDFPRGPGSDVLVALMTASAEIFADHPINKTRSAAGKSTATNVWLWGSGGAPGLPTFDERYGLKGVMITAVDLLRGLASLAGWDRIEVDGATGYLDTNYAGKGQAAVKALDQYDIVCVHIEAPDEASHEGRADAKVEALEQIDQFIAAPLWKAASERDDVRILILPDHPTYCRTKKHTHGPVPLVMAGKSVTPDAAQTYDEVTANASGLIFDPGWIMMAKFLGRE